jgi:hypothetical protein
MFESIFDMMGNYESRKVDNFTNDKLQVDTCAVTDSDEPFETGIAHPAYNDGKWVIVEMYNSAEEAQIGHDKWVATMTAGPLPSTLVDVSTSEIASLCRALNCIPPAEIDPSKID